MLSGPNSNHLLETTVYRPSVHPQKLTKFCLLVSSLVKYREKVPKYNEFSKSLGERWPFTGVSRALRARNPEKV